jgi:hypothetical protein
MVRRSKRSRNKTPKSTRKSGTTDMVMENVMLGALIFVCGVSLFYLGYKLMAPPNPKPVVKGYCCGKENEENKDCSKTGNQVTKEDCRKKGCSWSKDTKCARTTPPTPPHPPPPPHPPTPPHPPPPPHPPTPPHPPPPPHPPTPPTPPTPVPEFICCGDPTSVGIKAYESAVECNPKLRKKFFKAGPLDEVSCINKSCTWMEGGTCPDFDEKINKLGPLQFMLLEFKFLRENELRQFLSRSREDKTGYSLSEQEVEVETKSLMKQYPEFGDGFRALAAGEGRTDINAALTKRFDENLGDGVDYGSMLQRLRDFLARFNESKRSERR